MASILDRVHHLEQAIDVVLHPAARAAQPTTQMGVKVNRSESGMAGGVIGQLEHRHGGVITTRCPQPPGSVHQPAKRP